MFFDNNNTDIYYRYFKTLYCQEFYCSFVNDICIKFEEIEKDFFKWFDNFKGGLKGGRS